MAITIQELSLTPTFQGLPEDHIQWLIDHGQEVNIAAGDYLFKKGDQADNMYIVLEGKIQLISYVNGQAQPLNAVNKGEITGLLPYSRLKIAGGSGLVLENAKLLLIHRDKFPEMEHVSPELIERLIAIMTNRVREFTTNQQQTEKMVALGKLSAGLAHELNNPAAAAKRAASELGKVFLDLMEHFSCITKQESAIEVYRHLDKIQAWMKAETKISVDLDPLEQSEREDALLTWMEDKGVENPWELAPVLVSFGVTQDEADEHLKDLKGEDLTCILKWICLCINTRQLINEVEMSAGRISDIIKTVKSYSYMDQATYQEVNIHVGIEDTITMLKHKIKDGIKIEKDFSADLPKITLLAAEINQVWTNIIDNAIDALNGAGIIKISTLKEGNYILVRIKDNGPGIPPEALPKIFDPFFTTKPVGKGTGLGLDISYKIIKKHMGDIKVNSKPGETTFDIRLPIK